MYNFSLGRGVSKYICTLLDNDIFLSTLSAPLSSCKQPRCFNLAFFIAIVLCATVGTFVLLPATFSFHCLYPNPAMVVTRYWVIAKRHFSQTDLPLMNDAVSGSTAILTHVMCAMSPASRFFGFGTYCFNNAFTSTETLLCIGKWMGRMLPHVTALRIIWCA